MSELKIYKLCCSRQFILRNEEYGEQSGLPIEWHN